MKRTNKNTIAWWIKFFGFKLEYWHVFESPKTGCAALEVVCYSDDMSTHTFYF